MARIVGDLEGHGVAKSPQLHIAERIAIELRRLLPATFVFEARSVPVSEHRLHVDFDSRNSDLPWPAVDILLRFRYEPTAQGATVSTRGKRVLQPVACAARCFPRDFVTETWWLEENIEAALVSWREVATLLRHIPIATIVSYDRTKKAFWTQARYSAFGIQASPSEAAFGVKDDPMQLMFLACMATRDGRIGGTLLSGAVPDDMQWQCPSGGPEPRNPGVWREMYLIRYWIPQ